MNCEEGVEDCYAVMVFVSEGLVVLGGGIGLERNVWELWWVLGWFFVVVLWGREKFLADGVDSEFLWELGLWCGG